MLNLFGEDHEVPTTIPFYFRVITLRSKRGTAQAIGIHVGTLHKEFLETIITRSPFQDVELIPISMRRKNQSQYDQHIRLHKHICNNSCALKLLRTSEDARDAIRLEVAKDEKISDKVVDLAESSKTATDGTFYIQCLQKHKPTISAWIIAFLATYATVYPHDDQPIYPGANASSTDRNSTAATPSVWSKHQSFLDDDTPHYTPSETPTRKSIPESIIIGQNMSYAAATRSHRPSHYSNVSSPTNSKATHKTHRELYLETEVTNLRNEFAQFRASQTTTPQPGGTVSSKSSNKSIRELELENQVQQLTQMVNQQNQTLHHQAATIHDLKTTMQAFIAQFQLSGFSHPNLSVDRKRKDIPAQEPHISRRPSHGTNNAGGDTDMATPPDPGSEVPGVNTSFESANMSFIDTPNYDDESHQGSQTLDAPPRSHLGMSHIARSKSDMKKQC